jgi:hypothetical protein
MLPHHCGSIFRYAVWCAIVYGFLLLFWSCTPEMQGADEDGTRSISNGDIDDDGVTDPAWAGSIQEQKQLRVVGGDDGLDDDPINNAIRGSSGTANGADDAAGKAAPDETDLTQKGVWAQLKSWEFFFLVLFGSTQMLRANAYIGFNDELLAHYGDDVACNGWCVTQRVDRCRAPLFFVCDSFMQEIIRSPIVLSVTCLLPICRGMDITANIAVFVRG